MTFDNMSGPAHWMERLLTAEGYSRFRSAMKPWPALVLAVVGLLSDLPSLFPFVQEHLRISVAALLSGLSGFVLFFFIGLIVMRTRFCARCAGYLPHCVILLVVSGPVALGQKYLYSPAPYAVFGELAFALPSPAPDAVFGELAFALPSPAPDAVFGELALHLPTSPAPDADVAGKPLYADAGKAEILYKGHDGRVTTSNSIFGYLLNFDKKLDVIVSNVQDIKLITEDTDKKVEEILDIVKRKEGFGEEDEEKTRQLVASLLGSNPDIPIGDALSRLDEARKILQELQDNQLVFDDENPQIAALLRESDAALADGPDFSLAAADAALKNADALYNESIRQAKAQQIESEKERHAAIIGRRAALAAIGFNYGEATLLYARQAGLVEEVYGSDSAQYAESLSKQASNLVAQQDRFGEFKTLEVFERALAPDPTQHPHRSLQIDG